LAEPSDPAAPRKPPAAESPAGLSPGLYIVATPIGNARDITLRALDVLRAVDAIACEDTRVTARLLAIHGIARPLVAYHEHNAAKMRPTLVARLGEGARIALVSDAGTPLLSDPGYRLTRACIEAGIAITTLPGPAAAMAALTLAGQPTDRVLFAGFLPVKSGARRSELAEIGSLQATLVFYEAPHRLVESLADMAAVLGNRAAAVVREITKLFEETQRDTLPALAARYAAAGPPKGEIVIVVGPPAGQAGIDDQAMDDALRAALMAGNTVRDAAQIVAASHGWPKRVVYARALALSGAA